MVIGSLNHWQSVWGWNWKKRLDFNRFVELDLDWTLRGAASVRGRYSDLLGLTTGVRAYELEVYPVYRHSL